jgi:hypothetical protein
MGDWTSTMVIRLPCTLPRRNVRAMVCQGRSLMWTPNDWLESLG